MRLPGMLPLNKPSRQLEKPAKPCKSHPAAARILACCAGLIIFYNLEVKTKPPFLIGKPRDKFKKIREY
jgi:hypothetical protein